MGPTLRAGHALVLLAGFYLLSLILLVALGALDWAAFTWTTGPVALKLSVLSIVLAIPIARGALMLRTPKGDGMAGLPVDESAEPRLWATVRELAQSIGTRAPDEILLTGEVNAAVGEDTRFLGLVGGRRRLYIGLPLMAGLSEAQLRAVLAHEMGHYGNADTRLGAITARGRIQVIRTIGHFQERSDKSVAKERARQEEKAAKAVANGRKAKEVHTAGAGISYRAMAAVYTAYAKLYIRATLSGARRAELAADAAAARIAGREATASALRELPALHEAHDFYMAAYATLGVGAGLLPPPGQVFGGVRQLLAARTDELDELRRRLPSQPSSPYDSHPSIAERVALIEALPDDRRAAEGRDSALLFLRDPDATFTALEGAVLSEQTHRLSRAGSWQELLESSMRAGLATADPPLRRALAQYTGQEPTVAALLRVIDEGRLGRLTDLLPLSAEASAATGRARSEFARPALRAGLHQMALAQLAADSRLAWEFSWRETATARLPAGPDGRPADLDTALDAALRTAPDTAPLRALLTP
ncbi:M48 family metallopeptidase [Streptomyces sp. NBC_01022]|uniref:M48 family metallopeptidase n=1 Tax=Streptomyces sp. NBC_01022 TaxID=2903723 RepID=UPI002DD84139|nr:M48 family metallopeptidase [Streptomyces sp. NBC_01022]WRZ84027.1 M48 family metallopeptidase [Streptomyces sp. NBC_01022]